MAWRGALSKNLQELRWGRSAPRASRPLLAVPPLPLTPRPAPPRPCCRIHLCQTGKGSQGARCGPQQALPPLLPLPLPLLCCRRFTCLCLGQRAPAAPTPTCPTAGTLC